MNWFFFIVFSLIVGCSSVEDTSSTLKTESHTVHFTGARGEMTWSCPPGKYVSFGKCESHDGTVTESKNVPGPDGVSVSGTWTCTVVPNDTKKGADITCILQCSGAYP